MRLRYGLDFPTARLSSPIRWFPLRCCITALPRRDTRLPLSPHCNPPKAPQKMDSLGDFHSSHAASYPLLQAGFQGNRTRTLAGVLGASAPLSTVPTQGRLLCTQRYGSKGRVAPQCRFLAIRRWRHLPRTQVAYHRGSTPVHNSRSPRRQGRVPHAIEGRPTSAGGHFARLPPAPTPNWA